MSCSNEHSLLRLFSGALLMLLSRLAMVAVAAVGIVGCGKDSVTNPATPPLAGVRFINGLADSSSVDVRMIDQVNWSFNGVQNIAFRAGTEHQPIEAKARQIRVFPNSNVPAITSAYMVDTTISFTAGQRYTLLLVLKSRPTFISWSSMTTHRRPPRVRSRFARSTPALVPSIPTS